MTGIQRIPKVAVKALDLPILFELLSHRLRWAIVQQLSLGDVRVNEIVARLGEPMNVVSYHLKKMRDHGLITGRRSESDARDVYYALDLARLESLHAEATAALHPRLGAEPLPPLVGTPRILFVCSYNSARSQMAEAWLRHMGGSHFEVTSAGIHPGQLHPEAIRAMRDYGIDIASQQPKAIEQFAHEPFDLVVTVCDVAREQTPKFENVKRFVHWGVPNPSKAAQPDHPAAYSRTASLIRARVSTLISLLPHVLAPEPAPVSRAGWDEPTRPSF